MSLINAEQAFWWFDDVCQTVLTTESKVLTVFDSQNQQIRSKFSIFGTFKAFKKN